MKPRRHSTPSDIPDTRARLIEAAARVFAEVGYRDATIQDICSAARANIAAVNYHFGGKRNLYMAVWKHVFETVRRPALDRLRAISDPSLRLRETIRERLREEFGDEPGRHFRRLIHREMGDPTESHDEIRRRFVLPMLDCMTETMSALLGVSANHPSAHYCAFSLQSQLILLSILRQRPDRRPIRRLMGAPNPTPRKIAELAEHLIRFTMGGVTAVRHTRRKPPASSREVRA